MRDYKPKFENFMSETIELTTPEQFVIPKNNSEKFFDLLLENAGPVLNRDHEIAHRDVKIFCKYNGINGGDDNRYYTKGELALEFKMPMRTITNIIMLIWNRIEKKGSPITKHNIREEFSLPKRPRGKHVKKVYSPL